MWVRFIPSNLAYPYQDEECPACHELISLHVRGEVLDVRLITRREHEE